MSKFKLTLKGAFAFFVYGNGIQVHVPNLEGHQYRADDLGGRTFNYSKQSDYYYIHVKGSSHGGRFDPSRNVVLSGFHPSPIATPDDRLCVFYITTPDFIHSCDLFRPDQTSSGRPISPGQALFRGSHSGGVTARTFANGHEFIYDNVDASDIDISPALGDLRPQETGALVLIAESNHNDLQHRYDAVHATTAFDASMKLMYGVDLHFADQFHFTEDDHKCEEYAPLAPRACNGGTSVL